MLTSLHPQLELTLDDIKWAIIRAPKLKITEQAISINPRNQRLRIYVDDDKGAGKYFRLRMLKRAIPHIVVNVRDYKTSRQDDSSRHCRRACQQSREP